MKDAYVNTESLLNVLIYHIMVLEDLFSYTMKFTIIKDILIFRCSYLTSPYLEAWFVMVLKKERLEIDETSLQSKATQVMLSCQRVAGDV